MRLFGTEPGEDLPPRYNIAPTQGAPVVRRADDLDPVAPGDRVLVQQVADLRDQRREQGVRALGEEALDREGLGEPETPR